MNILEENDEKPICTPNSYFLAVPVDLKVGTNIQNFKLMCTDLDSSPWSFRYSIGAGVDWVSTVLARFLVRLLGRTGWVCAGGAVSGWGYLARGEPGWGV